MFLQLAKDKYIYFLYHPSPPRMRKAFSSLDSPAPAQAHHYFYYYKYYKNYNPLSLTLPLNVAWNNMKELNNNCICLYRHNLFKTNQITRFINPNSLEFLQFYVLSHTSLYFLLYLYIHVISNPFFKKFYWTCKRYIHIFFSNNYLNYFFFSSYCCVYYSKDKLVLGCNSIGAGNDAVILINKIKKNIYNDNLKI